MQKVEETLGTNMARFSAAADEDEILRRYEANFSIVYMGIIFNITNGGKDLRYKIRMTSDDSGLKFQMPGPNPRIGEESCRESGSSKPLEGPWSCPTNAYYYSG